MVRIYVLRTGTQAIRRQRHWLIAASTIDWSNFALQSLIRRVLSSSTSVIMKR